MTSVIACLKKYVTFTGRATRSEYWIFYIFTIILTNFPALIGIMLMVAGEENRDETIVGIGGLFIVLANLVLFALMIPNIAVGVRRLHDVGKSGSYLFIAFIPIIGPFILLLTLCEDSQRGENQYGISEKYPS